MNERKIFHEDFLAVAIGFLLAIFIFFLNYGVQGPMIQSDEGSYLASAAAIAGYFNDFANSFFSGYSFFIFPAFLSSDNPYIVWQFVKLINSILYFLIFLNLWWIAKYLAPQSEIHKRLLAVTLTAIYPMWVVMVGYSFPQILFVLVFLFIFYLYLLSIQGSLSVWLCLGLASGFLYWIHPTAVAPLLAVVVGTGYVSLKKSIYKNFGVFLIILIVMILLYRYVVTPWLYGRMLSSGNPPNLHYPSTLYLVSSLFSLKGLVGFISHLGGHVFYLIIGTVGLFWVGVFKLVSNGYFSLKRKGGDQDSLSSISIAILMCLSLSGIIILSALFFSAAPEATNRLDHWMYGRYVEGVIGPVLLVGLLYYSSRSALWAIPITLVCAFLLSMGLEDYVDPARFNISAFWQDFFLRKQGLWAWVGVGSFLIVLTAYTSQSLRIFLIGFVFMFCDYLQINWHKAASEDANKRWAAALKVKNDFPLGTCVGFDYTGVDSHKKHVYWFDFGFVLFNYQMKRMTFKQWFDSCDGPLFSYSQNLGESNPVYSTFIPKEHAGPIVWVKKKNFTDINFTEKNYKIDIKDLKGLSKILEKGWHQIESTHVWSSSEALLEVPIEGCSPEKCMISLTLSAYGASLKRPVEVVFEVLNTDLSPNLVEFTRSESRRVNIPISSDKKSVSILIRVPNAISPKELQGSPDIRILGVALFSIELLKKGNDLRSEPIKDL